MILQSAREGVARLAIRMDEHTGLAGQFARAFGNDRFAAVEPREVMLYMIEHHDSGWRDFDQAPLTDPASGLPYNLVDTPAEQITRTSTASPDFNERHHPYAGLLSSMHSWGLYNGRYGMSSMVLINTIPAQSRHLADRMLAGELARQARLKSQLATDPQTAPWIEPTHLMQHYKQLQFFDTLALYFNRSPHGARSEARFEHVPLSATEDCTVTVTPIGPDCYRIDPYPFAGTRLECSFTGQRLEPQPDADPQHWSERLQAQPAELQHFTLVAI